MRLQRGKGHSWKGERSKYLVNKSYPAKQISLSGKKIISGNRSLPDTDPPSNVNFLYKYRFSLQKCNFTVFSELFQCLQFLKNNQHKIILIPKKHIRGVGEGTFCYSSAYFRDFKKIHSEK